MWCFDMKLSQAKIQMSILLMLVALVIFFILPFAAAKEKDSTPELISPIPDDEQDFTVEDAIIKGKKTKKITFTNLKKE